MKKPMLLKIILLNGFIVFLFSCVNPKSIDNNKNISVKPYPHFINMSDGLQNKGDLTLSEIADSIKYIVLSKEKKIIIGNIQGIQLNDKYILIKCDDQVVRFDYTGRLLNYYGKIGRGPLEYIPGSIYTTTPNFDKVLILRSMLYDYLVYRIDGEYLGRHDLPSSRNTMNFVNMSDSVFLFTFWFAGNLMNHDILNSMPGLAGLFDQKGNSIKIIEHPLKKITLTKEELKRTLSLSPSITFFESRAILSTFESDTIYEISEKSILPGFILDWGSIPHAKNITERYFRQSESSNNIKTIPPYYETASKLYFRGRSIEKQYIFEYDKKTRVCRSMIVNKDNVGLINDFDGGAAFFPSYSNRNGNIWINANDAISFKTKHKEEILFNGECRYPDKKEKLKKLIDSLKDDDNPVLTIVYLKDFHKNL